MKSFEQFLKESFFKTAKNVVKKGLGFNRYWNHLDKARDHVSKSDQKAAFAKRLGRPDVAQQHVKIADKHSAQKDDAFYQMNLDYHKDKFMGSNDLHGHGALKRYVKKYASGKFGLKKEETELIELSGPTLARYVKSAMADRDHNMAAARSMAQSYVDAHKEHQRLYYGQKGDFNSQLKGTVRSTIFRNRKKKSAEQMDAFSQGYKHLNAQADKRKQHIDRALDKLAGKTPGKKKKASVGKHLH